MPDSEKNDALVHLAGSMAHELNNIFTAVTGNLSFLEGAFEKDDANSRLVDDVIRTARRGIELSRKLQAFAGRQPLKRTRVDVNQAVIHTVAGLKASLLRGVDVHLDLARAGCFAVADEENLTAALRELCSNAAAAMEHRGRLEFGTVMVTLKEREQAGLAAGSYALLSVRDRGHGMRPDVMARALDPFFTTRPGNRGLGLSQCAGFARQCRGNILLASTPGDGTQVRMYLPASR